MHWQLEKCDGMLSLYEIFENNDSVFLVLDYQEGGSLLSHLKKDGKFTEKQTKIIMQQLLLAIDFLH